MSEEKTGLILKEIREYLKENPDFNPNIEHDLDTFGHIGQLSVILKKKGYGDCFVGEYMNLLRSEYSAIEYRIKNARRRDPSVTGDS